MGALRFGDAGQLAGPALVGWSGSLSNWIELGRP